MWEKATKAWEPFRFPFPTDVDLLLLTQCESETAAHWQYRNVPRRYIHAWGEGIIGEECAVCGGNLWGLTANEVLVIHAGCYDAT
jgi:hypothetical protein